MSNILVVVDMQNDFIRNAIPAQGGEKIISNVVNKIRDYEKNEGIIIFTKDTHGANYFETLEGKNLPVEHCIKNTLGWEIIDELKELSEKHMVLNKNTFGSTQLAPFIKAKNKPNVFDTIELIGVCTGICVISNALILKSQFPEITISVDSSCCACVSKDSHQRALESMALCQIKIS